MAKVLLEICCGSLADALEAQAGGADRVELCSAPFLGGLTPSAGAILETNSRLRIPLVSMVRARSGGFCYSPEEFTVMERDASFALANGSGGIVFGMLREDGNIDGPRCKRLIKLAGQKQAIFSRAFDVVPDAFYALEQLIDLGFTRILTSGQQTTAAAGAGLIQQLVERAAGRIEILAAGSIRPENALDLVARTGCRQLHLTAAKTGTDPSTFNNPKLAFGAPGAPPEAEYSMTDRELVARMAQVLRG